MRIKVVSNGTSSGTTVVDAETGTPLENVVAVNWSCEGPFPSLATCTVLFDDVECDVEAEIA